MERIPKRIVYVAGLMFQRHLTDISGGNLSVRDGKDLYITPTKAGAEYHWQLDPDQILHLQLDDPTILSHPRMSREGRVHIAIYQTFPGANAVIHAHPFHVLPFAAAEKPIPPVIDSAERYGEIKPVAHAASNTRELADHVLAGLRGQEEKMALFAAAVLLPKHGIVIASADLFAALDALENIDWNAWCILAGRLIP